MNEFINLLTAIISLVTAVILLRAARKPPKRK